MKKFDPLTIDLAGLNLIEASAGTGKTHSITDLYVRLIVEKRLTVDRILVVTFTKAATAELRDRIRARLAERLAILESGAVSRAAPDEQNILQSSVYSFDEAAIFTIHGFCERVLRDNAFESGAMFDTELVTDLSRQRREIADDFWRRNIAGLSVAELESLQSCGLDAEAIFQLLQNHSRFIGDIEAPVLLKGALNKALSKLSECHEQIRKIWAEERTEILALLGDRSLSQTTYKPERTAFLAQQMDGFAANETPSAELFDKFELLTQSMLAQKTKKGGQTPRHAFFVRCEEYKDLAEKALQEARREAYTWKKEALLFCREHLKLRNAQHNIQGFDDLIRAVNDSIEGPGREGFIGAIRARYPVALIDEFQDTDLLQYNIFRALYAKAPDSVRFFIGDPKQSIYSFRGADVFSYLQAKKDAGKATHTLQVNWRSEPMLLQAVERLFSAKDAFLSGQIGFERVDPCKGWGADKPFLTIEGQREAPLRLWMLGADAEQTISKQDASREVARATAAEIARLLNLGMEGKALIGAEPVKPSDVAVLVRAHHEGDLIRAALRERGIPSAIQSQQGIFDSDEATELHRILRAATAPENERAVREATMTQMFGVTADRLWAMIESGSRWEELLERFQGYRQRWMDRGVMAMLQTLFTRDKAILHYACLPNSERRLTNLLHVAELLQQISTEQKLGPQELLERFEERLANRGNFEQAEDAEQLRLESDSHRVRIETIFVSKGLQYPIVFCPFAWNGGLHADSTKNEPHDPVKYHAPGETAKILLDVGTEKWSEHAALARCEERAENLRLLYVAMTRAIHRCYLAAGRIRDYETSALAYLLHQADGLPGEDRAEAIGARVKGLSGAEIRAEAQKLAKAGIVEVEALPPSPSGAPPIEPPADKTALFAPLAMPPGKISRDWWITSFSALAAGKHQAISAQEQADDTPPEPPPPPSGEDLFDVHHFPRGNVTGTLWHAIFEAIDFTLDASAREPAIRRLCAEYGFAPEWLPALTGMTRQVLQCSLPGGFRLADIAPGHCLKELEFHFPLARIGAQGLTKIVKTFLAPGDELTFDSLRGIMKGFMDLVVLHEGRFYLFDYKSNWLGPDTLSYAPEALEAAMRRERYLLQSRIYTVALHRYLGRTIPDYDFDRHFGGAYYLFLRGMDPERKPGWGVYKDCPPIEQVRQLSDFFQTGDAP